MSRGLPRAVRTSLVAGALGVLGLTTLAAPAAHAAPATADLPVTVEVTAITPAVLRPGEDLTVRAVVRNEGADEIAEPSVALTINRFRIGTRDDVAAWADADPSQTIGTVVDRETLEDPLEPGEERSVELEVPAAEVYLLTSADAWGPRGMAVEATDGFTRVGLERTFLMWLPTEQVPQTRLSVLAPVVGTASTTLVGTDLDDGAGEADLASLTEAGGRLERLLTATRGYDDVAWLVDPSVISAAQRTPAADAWVAQLSGAIGGRDVFALPWGDPDLAAAAHAGEASLLDLAAEVGDAADLSLLGVTPRTDLLLSPVEAPDLATSAVAAGLRASGLVVGPDALPPATDLLTPGARVDVATPAGTAVTLVPDATLTDLLVDPSRVTPGATPATAAQRALAETSVIPRQPTADVRHLLVALPRDWAADPTVVAAQLDAYAQAPWVRLSPMSALLGSTDLGTVREDPVGVSVDPAELDPSDLEALADARAKVSAFSEVLEDPDALLDQLDQQVLAPTSVAWRTEPGTRADVVAAVLAGADASTDGLSIAPLSSVSVISQSSERRFTVRNDLEQAATVRLAVSPRKACLAVVEEPVVTVAAGSAESVPVTLDARANCDVLVEAVLTTVSGTPVSEPVTFAARVAPTIENVGTAVVGALLAVGLVLGIVRTVRRGQGARRGARRVSEAEAEIEAQADDATDDGTATAPDPATDSPTGTRTEDRP